MKLERAIRTEMNDLAAGDSKLRVATRARQVLARYRQTIEKVYRSNAPLFLEHTNSVYIMNKNGVKTLIVYMDESIYAAELNAQRELIRLHMHQMFGEDIQEFEIHVSRGSYKSKHPYKDESSEETLVNTDECAQALSADKEAFIEQTLETVEDDRLKISLKKVMTADLKRYKNKR